MLLRYAFSDLLRGRMSPRSPVGRHCHTTTSLYLLQRGLRVLLRHALSDLLRGRVSPRALVPTTDRGLQELVVHVSELPDEELLTVLKVKGISTACPLAQVDSLPQSSLLSFWFRWAALAGHLTRPLHE